MEDFKPYDQTLAIHICYVKPDEATQFALELKAGDCVDTVYWCAFRYEVKYKNVSLQKQ